MLSKLDLTKLFLEKSGLVISPSDLIVKTYLKDWWATPFSPIGLRLSTEGNRFLKDVLRLECYSFKIKESNTKSLKLFLQMNRRLSSPYYLQGNRTIVLYGEQDSIMLALLDGDLEQYFNNFSR